MKKFLFSLFGLALLFIAFILIRTFTFQSIQLEVEPIEKVAVDPNAVKRFRESLRIKTISFEEEENFDSLEFGRFNAFLEDQYPLVDSLLGHQVFSGFSHLYHWKGVDETLQPIILMGHIDVVPIASPAKWTVDPFAADLSDGKIWGRGTIDDKFSVIAILEAVNQLLIDGYRPSRDIFLAFGHDEEVGGEMGAVKIVEFLSTMEVNAEYVLDEGYAITQKLIPGVDNDIALIGVAEKGSATIEFAVDMDGGHSSQPASETAIDVLARAISKLKSNPLTPKLSEPMIGFMDHIGPHMNFVNKMAFANREIFESVIIDIYENASGAGNALVRTTTAPTIFQAGIKENVIPTFAKATVNFRIMSGETPETVMDFTKDVIADERVKLSFKGFNTAPSKVSSHDSDAYKVINSSIKQVFGDVLTAPNLVIAATDSRHFEKISDNVYRFVPYHINKENIDSFHGIDEHIAVEDFENAIRFYKQLILNSEGIAEN